jgi:ferredoxin-nitrite reductase
MNEFGKAIRSKSNLDLPSAGVLLLNNEFKLDNNGVYELNYNKSAVHFSIPSGILSGDDLIQAGETALEVDGFIKLSVEQSFYVVTTNDNITIVKNSELYKKYESFHNIYFNNLVACAGTATCSFAVIENKPDAIMMAKYLHETVPMDEGKIRLYWSACPKGCGLHGIADIGFEGCIVKDSEGNKTEGVHIFLGGKATTCAAEARLIVKSVTM